METEQKSLTVHMYTDKHLLSYADISQIVRKPANSYT